MVTTNDINRLLAEQAGQIEDNNRRGLRGGLTVEQWLEREKIEVDVLRNIAEEALPLMKREAATMIQEGKPAPEAFDDSLRALVMMHFMLGWDAHKQYGEVKTGSITQEGPSGTS